MPVTNWADALAAPFSGAGNQFQERSAPATVESRNDNGFSVGTTPRNFTNPWTNPTNASVEDGTYATVTVPASSVGSPTYNPTATYWLVARNFGFSLPNDAVVHSIVFAFKYRQTAGDTVGNGPVIYDFGVLKANAVLTRCTYFWDDVPLPAQSGGFTWPYDGLISLSGNDTLQDPPPTFTSNDKISATTALNTDFYMSTSADFGDFFGGGDPSYYVGYSSPDPTNGATEGPWWSPAEVNDSAGFGCAFSFASFSGGTIAVDAIRMRVYFTSAILPPPPPTSVPFPISSYVDSSDTPLSNGYLLIRLTQDGQYLNGAVNQQLYANKVTRVPLDANGVILGTPLFAPSASITPSGLQYILRAYTVNGELAAGPLSVTV